MPDVERGVPDGRRISDRDVTQAVGDRVLALRMLRSWCCCPSVMAVTESQHGPYGEGVTPSPPTHGHCSADTARRTTSQLSNTTHTLLATLSVAAVSHPVVCACRWPVGEEPAGPRSTRQCNEQRPPHLADRRRASETGATVAVGAPWDRANHNCVLGLAPALAAVAD